MRMSSDGWVVLGPEPSRGGFITGAARHTATGSDPHSTDPMTWGRTEREATEHLWRSTIGGERPQRITEN
jgi:hypothetical protein